MDNKTLGYATLAAAGLLGFHAYNQYGVARTDAIDRNEKQLDMNAARAATPIRTLEDRQRFDLSPPAIKYNMAAARYDHTINSAHRTAMYAGAAALASLYFLTR